MAGGAHADNSGDRSRIPGAVPARSHGHPQGHRGESPAQHRPSLWLSTPWVAILFITAAFHFYRGVPVDSWIFLSAALALAVDTTVRHRQAGAGGPRRVAGSDGGPGAGPRSSPAMPQWLWISTAAGVGAVPMAVVFFAPGSGSAMAFVVALVGAAMLLVVWPDPVPDVAAPAVAPPAASPAPAEAARAEPAPRRLRRAAWCWGAVLLFLCLWELGSYFIDRFVPADATEFPPLTDLLQPLFDGESSRWFMLMLWLFACGALVRVVRRP